MVLNKDLADLPAGKYTMVGIDVDTTGRRLIDEIVQLAAYTPDTQYAQYIMPYMNLNPAARQRHQVRVITIGFYRLLKCMQTYKVVKSKSEYAALKEFLDWIENVQKADVGSQGVVFVYHEERKFIPYMVLEAMKKYDLLDRFLKTAKSFANGYKFAEEKCTSDSVKNMSLRSLSKHLFNNNLVSEMASESGTECSSGTSVPSSSPPAKESPNSRKTSRSGSTIGDMQSFEGSASVRAKLAFNIAMQLSTKVDENSTGDGSDQTSLTSANMLTAMQKYVNPISIEFEELDIENKNLERQNSFRPVFLLYFKTALYHRVKAVKFRIVLAENGHDLNSLKVVWTEKQKEGLEEVIQAVPDLKPEEKTELVELFDSYFDPIKTTIKPVVNRSKRRNRNRNRNKENRPRDSTQAATGDKISDKKITNNNIPDSTTKTPSKIAMQVKSTKVMGTNNNNNNNNIVTPLPITSNL